MIDKTALLEKIRKTLTVTLICFALISAGFALGKHSPGDGFPAPATEPANGHQVYVYYLHSSFRCVTCNTIEEMTKKLLDNSYSDRMTAGQIRWIEDDFQENEELAEQFGVAASCVVVAEVMDGVLLEFNRLDDVWTKMKDPVLFNQYVGKAIDRYLQRTGEPL